MFKIYLQVYTFLICCWYAAEPMCQEYQHPAGSPRLQNEAMASFKQLL